MDTWFPLTYPDAAYRADVLRRWNNAVIKAKNGNGLIQAELYVITCADGTERTVSIGGQLHEDGFITTFVDMTNEEAAKRDLRESNDQLRELMEEKNAILKNKTIGFAYVKDYTYTWVSERMCEIFGFEQHEIIGKTPLLFSRTEERLKANIDMLNRNMVNGVSSIDADVFRKDGREITVKLSATLLTLDDPTSFVASYEDITTQKKLQREIIDERVKFKSLLDNASDGVHIVNEKGNLLLYKQVIREDAWL